jgi:type II secretory ATPase GspE/PulE/Tfp pilus assembly ATPase PilB-like protein
MIPDTLTLYKAQGCPQCRGTGYRGRASVFEGIIMDEAVEEAVIRDPREHVIVEAARPQKLPSMAEDGIEKVIQGITSLDELQRVVELPHVSLDGVLKHQNPTPQVVSDDDFNSHVV